MNYIYGHETHETERVVPLSDAEREVNRYKDLAKTLYKALKMQTPEAEYESTEEMETCISERLKALEEAERIL